MIITSLRIEDAAPVTRLTRVQAVHRRHRINVDARGQSFGDRVQDARERAGLTQTQLADRAGLSVQTIRWTEWERPKFVLADTLARIARALGVGMEELWTGETAEMTTCDECGVLSAGGWAHQYDCTRQTVRQDTPFGAPAERTTGDE